VKFIVNIDAEAMVDWQEVKARDERKATLNVLDKLMELGPSLAPPHAKSLKGEADLFELRPRQGKSKTRPIYAREGDQFVVLAFAADHASDGGVALERAQERLARRQADRHGRASERPSGR
jgi:hypothetical protein